MSEENTRLNDVLKDEVPENDAVREAIRAMPRQPFLLQPAGKDYLWGGTRLHSDFHLEGLSGVKPLAEAWVCSTHKDGESTVAVYVPSFAEDEATMSLPKQERTEAVSLSSALNATAHATTDSSDSSEQRFSGADYEADKHTGTENGGGSLNFLKEPDKKSVSSGVPTLNKANSNFAVNNVGSVGKFAGDKRTRNTASLERGLSIVKQTLNAKCVYKHSGGAVPNSSLKSDGPMKSEEGREIREDGDVRKARKAQKPLLRELSVPLSQVLREHPEWLGTHALQTLQQAIEAGAELKLGQLPILVKLIDAAQPLSVQVHPDDEYAQQHENGQLGKTEMWYVVDATEGAQLIYGFNQPTSPAQLRKAIKAGKLEKLLNSVPVRKRDLFFIGAGTVHAIGAGCLIAEVQESSNLTYRLYDYNRRDKDGRLRELHIDKALEVLKLGRQDDLRRNMRVLRYKRKSARELLARCRYFQVERLLVKTRDIQQELKLEIASNSFHTVLCLDGEITICSVNGKHSFICDNNLEMRAGNCVFIPAGVSIALYGNGELLDISC